jgi:hypothetical protein
MDGSDRARTVTDRPSPASISTALTDVVSRLEGALRDARRYELRVEELERRLAVAESADRARAAALTISDERAARVTSLYVATYQLHASLDPADVRATIAEIASNLLGAESFALLLRPLVGAPLEVALEQGLSDDTSGLFAGGKYVGRHPLIDGALTDGVLRVAEGPSDVIAVVPLVVQDAIVGALVILKLLRHRGSLVAHDRDLLDLLGAHAATALFVAQVHSANDRKLKTLESLVKLAQRS